MMKLREYAFYKDSGEMCTPEEILKGVDAYAVGKICGKYKDSDGTKLRTAKIVDIDDRVITTRNGMPYTLESMHPEYKEFLLIKAAETL